MKNRVIVAAAGAGKTEHIIEQALQYPEKRVLIVTYTNPNAAQITRRIYHKAGRLPPNVTILTWYRFLMREFIRPYQAFYVEMNYTRAINFVVKKPPRPKGGRSNYRYFYDQKRNIYRDRVSELAVYLNGKAAGAPIHRLETLYDMILFDEVQDVIGYDLDILELIFRSSIETLAVGDPRQVIYSTHTPATQRNLKYYGENILYWFQKMEYSGLVHLESMDVSKRCCPEICQFASEVYPEYPPIKSESVSQEDHVGIFAVREEDVPLYMKRYTPVPLRYRATSRVTHGVQATNIGHVKGETFDRVLIFPTQNWRRFLRSGSHEVAGDRSRLYVAVTRARYSAAFVLMPGDREPTRAKLWKPSYGRDVQISAYA